MDALLEALDPTQRDAVTSRAAPLAILAGAGSGKTRVLTRRIAWQSREELIDPAHVLAVTFTRKAAGELRSRLARLGVRESVTAGTFHAIALAQLRRRADEQGRTMPELLDRKVRILMRLLPGAGRDGALAAAELASEIEWAKARLVKPDGYEAAVTLAGRTTPRPPAEVAEVYAAYEREKRKRGLVDFDDLISGCADVLERDAEFAAAQRWRFRHLFVDEFQDASPAQFRLRARLARRPQRPVRRRRPRPGDLRLRRRRRVVPRRVPPRVPGRALPRGRDGAARQQLPVDAPGRVGRERSARSTRASASARARGASRRTAPHLHRVPHRRRRSARRRARAAGVGERRSSPGRAWPSSTASNAQSALFEEALTRAGIPFRVRGGERFLDRPEVQVALDELRTAAREGPHRPFAEHLTDLTHSADDTAELVPEERREHVDALVRLGHEYLEADGGRGSVDGFLEFLHTSLRGDDAGNSTGNAVELLTFHRAKGLEFDTVFVTGLERGLVPISHAEDAGSDGRGATAPLRRAEPSRARAQPHLGT